MAPQQLAQRGPQGKPQWGLASSTPLAWQAVMQPHLATSESEGKLPWTRLGKHVLTQQAVMQLHLARQRSKGDCDSSESDSPSGPSGDLGVPASLRAAEGSYSAAQAMVRDR